MYSRKRGQLLAQQATTIGARFDKKELRLSVSYVAIESVHLDPRNPRKHSKQQVQQIITSIEAHGFVFPIVATRDGKIVSGHGRYMAAKRLKLKEVPVISLEHVSEHQARAIALADNRLVERSTWDDKLLGEILLELSDIDLDFSLDATGFSMPEIDFRIENAEPAAKPDRADEVPVPFQGPPVSKVGDLWLFADRHRVLCGNALDPASYEVLMQGEKAQTCFVDPPYGVKVSNVSGFGSIEHREFPMNSGEMTPEERKAFHAQLCLLLAVHTVDGAIIYICIDAPHLGEVIAAGEAAFDELKAVCTWVKHNAGMGSLYRSRTEFVLVFKSGKSPHINNILLGKHGRNRDTVWAYPGMNLFGRGGEEGNVAAVHPTVKPVRLVSDALLDCSHRCAIVLDGCLGSGTTVIAAERTGRRCYGLELDPGYCDVIIRRWQSYSGERAIHAATGKTFDDLAAEAGYA